MKLLEQHFEINDVTYEPELILKISIPIEAIKNGAAQLHESDLYKIYGEQLVDLLKEAMDNERTSRQK